jgi:hypothetical protein
VVASLTGTTVVRATGSEPSCVEALHSFTVDRLESQVDAPRWFAVGADKQFVDEEVTLILTADVAPESREDRDIKALAYVEVRDAQVDVIEQSAQVIGSHGSERYPRCGPAL